MTNLQIIPIPMPIPYSVSDGPTRPMTESEINAFTAIIIALNLFFIIYNLIITLYYLTRKNSYKSLSDYWEFIQPMTYDGFMLTGALNFLFAILIICEIVFGIFKIVCLFM